MAQSPQIARVLELMESAERVTGLRLCLKLLTNDFRLPYSISHHTSSVCRAMKKVDELACTRFVYRNVMVEVPALPEGRVHRCPHGLIEVAVPVSRDGVVRGVLMGGQCWTDPSPPFGDLIVPADTDWIEDRRRTLLCIAGEIGRILHTPDTSAGSRAVQIQEFIHSRYHAPISINDLAGILHLSPSRTRHVVRECFSASFTDLVNAFRLERAAELLGTTRLAVGDIAELVGIPDQAYMTRLFTRRYHVSPRTWRSKSAPALGSKKAEAKCTRLYLG